MGKIWVDCDKDELVLNYNGILWGLNEGVHCLVRKRNGTNYVIPKFHSTKKFNAFSKHDMLDAKTIIEDIWKERYDNEPIPELELQIITHEEYSLQDMGWDIYKESRLGMQDIIEDTEESNLIT